VKDANGTLLLILGVALIAPLIASSFPQLRVPALVLEILFGIIIGPQVLDLVAVTPPIELLANLGLASLIFMAGFELDPQRLKGEPMRLASLGWALSIVLGLALALLFHLTGLVISQLFVGLALTTTALGTLLPIMRDAGLLPTRLGTHVLAVGSVGEFGPIIAIALVLSGSSPADSVESLLVFVAVAILVFVWARRPGDGRFRQAVGKTIRSSGQLYVRLALLLVAALAWVAAELGLDFLLGAFTAGMIYRLFLSSAGEEEVETVELKLEAVSFGYVISIFFVVTGVTYDLDALLNSAKALVMVPLFLVSFLIVRGVPVLLYRKDLPDPNDRRALVFFSATALPLVVAITTLGVEAQQMRPSTAAALVGAGMVSVILFPLLGMASYRRKATPEASEAAAPA
jgi:Kef-type K+ transport system membrane component KefB